MVESVKKHRFEVLDSFRGLAAVMIVLFHSQFYTDGTPNTFIRNSYIFVDFFFVLSGFVMAYAYLGKVSHGISFSKFIVKRFARLYPLHLFTLLVWLPYIAVKTYLYQQGIGATDPGIENSPLTFIQNLLLLQGFSVSTSWNYPSWSIGVEFYTYILFFIAVHFMTSHIRRFNAVIFVFIATTAYVMLIAVLDDVSMWKNIFRCVSEFFFGVTVYFLHYKYSMTISKEWVATLLETLLLILTVYLVTYMNPENGLQYFTVLVFMAIVYLFAIQDIGCISRLLKKEFFRHLGKISYSIYMTHAIFVTGMYNIMIYVFKFQPGGVMGIPEGVLFSYTVLLDTILVVVVIGVSTLTYKYIEVPGQKYIKRRSEKNGK